MTRAPASPAQRPQNTIAKQEAAVTDEQRNAALLDQILGKPMKYVPLGESEVVELRWSSVIKLLCKPTKNGHMPSDSDVYAFMMVCRQRQLNPYAGDCWLIGYDTNDGPVFNVVVAVQALFKRADVAKTAAGCPAFEGIQSGVVVMRDQEVIEREGDLVLDGEVLVGGWAKVYRADRKYPFYQRLKLSSYNKNRSMWKTDPAGQISKCAEAAALRQAFPSDVGGLYLAGEMDRIGTDQQASDGNKAAASSTAQALKDRLLPKTDPRPAETVVGKTPPAPEVVQTRPEAPGEHDQDAPQGTGTREPGADDPEPEISEATNSPEAVESPEVQFGR